MHVSNELLRSEPNIWIRCRDGRHEKCRGYETTTRLHKDRQVKTTYYCECHCHAQRGPPK